MNTAHCIKICNGLLRNERTAFESYDLVLGAFPHNQAPAELRKIRDEHASALSTLEENVQQMGGVPDLETGDWGSLAGVVQSAADVMGTKTAVTSLETWEKAGKHDYEAALEDAEVMPACKDLIRQKLLPALEEHIATLERMLEAA